jgi:hypothetical protein
MSRLVDKHGQTSLGEGFLGLIQMRLMIFSVDVWHFLWGMASKTVSIALIVTEHGRGRGVHTLHAALSSRYVGSDDL